MVTSGAVWPTLVSHKTSMNVHPTKITVTTMLHAPILRAVLPVNAMPAIAVMAPPAPMITNAPMALTAAITTPPAPTPRAATAVTVTPVTLAAAPAARMWTNVLQEPTIATATPLAPTPMAASVALATVVTLAAA